METEYEVLCKSFNEKRTSIRDEQLKPLVVNHFRDLCVFFIKFHELSSFKTKFDENDDGDIETDDWVEYDVNNVEISAVAATSEWDFCESILSEFTKDEIVDFILDGNLNAELVVDSTGFTINQ